MTDIVTFHGDDRPHSATRLADRLRADWPMDRQEYQPGRGTWLMFRCGRKRDAGRVLDGRTWDEMPR